MVQLVGIKHKFQTTNQASGVGKCPNWTSPNKKKGIDLQQILFSRDVNHIPPGHLLRNY